MCPIVPPTFTISFRISSQNLEDMLQLSLTVNVIVD